MEQVNKNGVEYLREEIEKFKSGGKIKEMKKGGSGIHIKPENKGKFTKSDKAADKEI